ncbi:hypothetical protein [Peterkaempfera sp. SMS 1(5)a]|uniref:hypothetical protein n=1 Tax=Peterkaempfera podocarpi TaxID=3232308 RepID=UPI00366E0E70
MRTRLTAAITAALTLAGVAAATPAGALTTSVRTQETGSTAPPGWTLEAFPPGDTRLQTAARVGGTIWASGLQVVDEGSGKDRPPTTAAMLFTRDAASGTWSAQPAPDGYRGRINSITGTAPAASG